jgi:uncharacterized repeat protein (TIGR03803 family)
LKQEGEQEDTKMRHLSGITRLCPRLTKAVLVLTSLLLSAGSTQSMQAQTFHLLHAFDVTDGATPVASLIRDSAGNLYGTTNAGGTSNGGTVFKLDKAGTLTVLHNFSGPDGVEPQPSVLRDATGNLYGTTAFGGAAGFGTVYKIDASGTQSVLYSFTGESDGEYPLGNLVRDKTGNLYSTTSAYLSENGGTVFKLDTTGKLTTLHTFTGADGYTPTGNLVRDAAGNLYGTCGLGGTGGGTVWKLDRARTLTVLHTFGGTDGSDPSGGLIADTAGNLYGAAVEGGSNNAGTVFQVAKETGLFTLLYTFDYGTAAGALAFGTLARDSTGNLYGSNIAEGGGCPNNLEDGCGTIWKLDTNNQLTVLTNFGKGNQGKTPYGGVILDKAGNLYGTTSSGGRKGCPQCGTVFKITP